MDYEIVTQARRMVVGIPHKGANDYEKIAVLWNELYERLDEIKDQSEGGVFYGLCEAVDPRDNQLNYLAGVSVQRLDHIPRGMQAWFVTHEEYLVYSHRGDARHIGESFEKIYYEILPSLGLYPGDEYDFECYRDELLEKDPPEVQLYVPVVKQLPRVSEEGWRKARKLLLDEEKAILHGEE